MIESNKSILKISPSEQIDSKDYFTAHSQEKSPSKLILDFLSLSVDDICKLYCENVKNIEYEDLIKILKYVPKYLFSSGADLMKVTDRGEEKYCLIEVNSVATGVFGFPMLNSEYNPYQRIIEDSFSFLIKEIPKGTGVIAILSDQIYKEVLGYCAMLPKILNESVYLIDLKDMKKAAEYYRVGNEYLEIKLNGKWTPIRAAIKYVQDQPWLKMPIISKTFIFNNLLGCLCGGRNKSMANIAYKKLESSLPKGVNINHPYTESNLTKKQVLKLVEKRGIGVVKGLYSNSGREVFFLIKDRDIKEFEDTEFEYDNFIYQDLIGHQNWISDYEKTERFCHFYDYVYDIRLVISYTQEGFKPISILSRRAPKPLNPNLDEISDFKEMLLTNLSSCEDPNRFILYDQKTVDLLGITLQDLIECYVQAVLATVSVDSLCKDMVKDGKFDINSFSELNSDKKIVEELEKLNVVML
jgi:hypothetical protein